MDAISSKAGTARSVRSVAEKRAAHSPVARSYKRMGGTNCRALADIIVEAGPAAVLAQCEMGPLQAAAVAPSVLGFSQSTGACAAVYAGAAVLEGVAPKVEEEVREAVAGGLDDRDDVGGGLDDSDGVNEMDAVTDIVATATGRSNAIATRPPTFGAPAFPT